MTTPGRAFTAIAMLAFVAAFAAGQPKPVDGRTACVFPVTDLSPSPAAAGAGREDLDRPGRLQALICRELSAVGLQLVPESTWRAGATASLSAQDLQDPSRLAAIAKAAGAGFAVSASFTLEEDRIRITVSCYDAETGQLHAGFTRTWPYNLALFSALHAQIQTLAVRLAALPESSPDGAQTTEPAASTPDIPPPVVTLAPVDRPAAADANRSSRAPKRLETEAGWTAGQLIGAGVGFRAYPVPDWLFVCLSFYPYGQAPASSTGCWLFHLDSEILVGSYLFFPPDSFFRLGASAGVGFILSEVISGQIDTMSYSDIYLNLLSAWAEMDLPPVSFFIRPELKLALGITSPNLLGTSFMLLGNAFVPVTLGATVRM